MPLDSMPIFSILDRVTDANGDPVSGGTVEFYEAGTTTAKTVYSNATLATSLGSIVSLDAGGYPVSGGSTKVLIYTGTDDFKVVVKDASGTTLITHDNVPGAVELPTADDAGLPETPVVSRTSTYVVLLADKGKLINADPTGGSFAVTLLSALVAGDGFRIGVRHAGTANVVTTRTTGGQTIGAVGQSTITAQSLTGRGHTRWYVSDGAGWTVDTEVPPLMSGPVPVFRVTDRLTAPPASPVGGARYIVNGTATGAWATLSFAEHDVVESDGNGSWHKYTPANGWMAWIEDEDRLSIYHDAAWSDQTGMAAPSSSTLGYAVYEHQTSSGTGGGTNTNGSWATRPLTTEVVDSVGMSVAANEITVPIGKYLVTVEQQLYQENGTLGATGIAQQRLTAVTATFDALYLGMPTRNGGVASGAGVTFTNYNTHALRDTYILNVTVAGTIKLEYKTNWTTASSGLGVAANNGVEVYARVSFLNLASLQGPQGTQGVQGEGGLDAAHAYQFNTATSGDPGTGKVLFNNATLASATVFHVSETSASAAALALVIASWDNSTSTSSKSRVRISKEGAPANFVEFYISNTGTDQGTYWTFPIVYIGSGGTLANGDDLAVLVTDTGDIGDPGTTVPDPSGLSLHTDFDDETDRVVTYDTSAGATKAVLGKNLGFTQSGTGAVLRRLQDKLRDVVDARDFGLSASASATNNRTYLQAAVTRLGVLGRSRLILPPGEFDITGDIASSATSFSVEGAGRAQTFITSSNLNSPIFAFTGGDVKIKGLGLNYSSTPTTGADAIQLTGEFCEVADVWVLTADRCIVLSGASGTDIHGCKLTSFIRNGIVANNTVGGRWSRIHMNAGSATTRGTLGCISLTNATEAIQMDSIECLEGLYSIATDATGTGFGNVPAYHHWTNCIFDAAGQGSLLTKLSTSVLTNCWFSGGRTGAGFHGVTIDNCQDLLFVNPSFINCGAAGASITATSARIRIITPNVCSNSVTAGSGTNHGIEIAANTNDVSVLYPNGGNSAVPGGQQGYDVFVPAGTSGRVVIRHSGAGGLTGTVSHSGSGTGNVVEVNGSIYNGPMIPFFNDGGALGASGQAWSDLFLASGSVINWNAGDLTLTHSSNLLTLSGGALTVQGALTTTGNLTVTGDIQSPDNVGSTAFYGGAAFNTGAGIALFGNAHATAADEVWIANAGFTPRVKILSTGVLQYLQTQTTAGAPFANTAKVTINVNGTNYGMMLCAP